MRHRQNRSTKGITLDPNEYAASLRTIAHADLSGKKADEVVSPELHSLYRSLLGAVAFLLLTRIDVVVFASAFQRWGHAPKIVRVKRLNVLTKWIQADPKCLVYKVFAVGGDRHVAAGSHLRTFSDSAFKKEEQIGHCIACEVPCICSVLAPRSLRLLRVAVPLAGLCVSPAA